MKASPNSRTLSITGSGNNDGVHFDDVLVGEVWLCSGQSNMDFTVAKTEKYYFAGVNNEAQEVAAADYPRIRMFTGDWSRNYEPQTQVNGKWKLTTPDNVREFSAIGYFFARNLHNKLNVPIGIITLTYGASTIQAWIRRDALVANPQLQEMLAKFDADTKSYRSDTMGLEKYTQSLKQWDIAAAAAKAEGKPSPRKPRNLNPVEDQHNPTVMFNGMIAPVIPYAIRGVLWYQGESITTGGVALYPLLQKTLIEDWRKLWNRDDLPFFIVQLAANKAPSSAPSESSIAKVREAQTTVLALRNTGMAVTIDIGDAQNIHPRNKQDVGDRLTRIALAKTYARGLEYSGPVYESMKIEGGAVRIKFSHLGGGLVAKDGTLKQFAIAGADKQFVWAEARIEGDSVIVSNPAVTSPSAVRYAWSDNPEGCNLYNAAGLPAAPFRTDR